jgi:hypothetical protein
MAGVASDPLLLSLLPPPGVAPRPISTTSATTTPTNEAKTTSTSKTKPKPRTSSSSSTATTTVDGQSGHSTTYEFAIVVVVLFVCDYFSIVACLCHFSLPTLYGSATCLVLNGGGQLSLTNAEDSQQVSDMKTRTRRSLYLFKLRSRWLRRSNNFGCRQWMAPTMLAARCVHTDRLAFSSGSRL